MSSPTSRAARALLLLATLLLLAAVVGDTLVIPVGLAEEPAIVALRLE